MTAITAHRGGAGLWPENSLTAFRGAVGLAGLDAVELDVRPCRDGALVVIHDETLDRTTDRAGPLIERSFAAVRESRLQGTEGEPPPTLEEVLALLVPTRVALKLEIKVTDGADAADMVRRCLEATAAYDMTGRTLFMSFDAPALEALSEVAPAVRFSALSSWPRDNAEARMARFLSGAVGLGAAAIGIAHEPRAWPQGQVAARAELIARARAAGLLAGVWTVDTPEELAAWLAEGAVDDVTTDRPDRALLIRDTGDDG
jgi:glycerophosphoryl diester phosphodiesterase